MDDNFKSPEDNVYTFKDVVFRVNQTQIGVSRMVLSSFDNDVPKVIITASTVPYDARGEVTQLANSLRHHDSIQKWSGTTDTEVRLEFKVESKRGTQTVVLDNWILLPSGLDPASVGNTISATYMLAHPAILADTNTLSIYNLPLAMSAPAITGANPYACFINALDAFMTKVKSLEPTDADEGDKPGVNDQAIWDLNKQMIDAVQQSVDALKANTRWAGPDALPYQGIWDNSDKIPDTLWDYVYQFNRTPYDAFNQFLGDFMLVSSGVFDDKPLEIYPFVPWGTSVGHIYDSQIESITVPFGDRATIGTVVLAAFGAAKEFGYLPPGAYGQPGVEGDSLVPTTMYAYGWHLDFVGKLIGKIQDVYLPTWMKMVGELLVKDLDEPHDDKDINVPEDADKAQGDPAAAADALINDETFATTVKAYAEDALFTVFNMGQQVSLTTRLMIRSDTFNAFGGDMLRPGVVISVRSVEKDDDLLYFYVNRVEHTIDIDRAQAFTSLTGGFYRTPAGIVGKDGTVLVSPETVKNGKPLNMYKDFSASTM